MAKKKNPLNKYRGDQRRTWAFSPISRVVESKKIYKRSREKRTKREDEEY